MDKEALIICIKCRRQALQKKNEGIRRRREEERKLCCLRSLPCYMFLVAHNRTVVANKTHLKHLVWKN
mgnify:CR=1 FL=1